MSRLNDFCKVLQCESKIHPCGFLKIFPKRLGIFNQFLADRTNGRAYATVLRPSVVVVCRL